MFRACLVTSLSVASMLAAAAVAPAQAGRDTATVKLTSKNSATSAGFSATATFAPERVVDQVTIALPSGSKLSLAGLPKCDRGFEELSDKGGASKNCPANSRLGTGTATAVLGENAPAQFTTAIYQAREGLVLDILLNGQLAFLASPEIKGTKLVIGLPAAKELNARVTRFAVSFKKSGTKAKPFFRTPAKCPSSGKLKASVQARADGKTVVTPSTVKCTPPKS